MGKLRPAEAKPHPGVTGTQASLEKGYQKLSWFLCPQQQSPWTLGSVLGAGVTGRNLVNMWGTGAAGGGELEVRAQRNH